MPTSANTCKRLRPLYEKKPKLQAVPQYSEPVDPAKLIQLFVLFFGGFFQLEKRPRKSKAKNQPGFYERIFTIPVTAWYLIFQRLKPASTLQTVVDDLRNGGANALNPKLAGLAKADISKQTTSFSDGRQRLPLSVLQQALQCCGDILLNWVGMQSNPEQAPAPSQRLVQPLDGSTLLMTATDSIAKDYPPARNQHGQSHWSLMRIVVGFCAKTGAVLSAVEGAAVRVSEQVLAWTLFQKARRFVVWVADRNFGIYSVVERAQHFQQDVLFRMMEKRAQKLNAGSRKRPPLDQRVSWNPTRHDKLAPGAKVRPIEGRLIFVRLSRNGFRPIALWLFTTLLDAQQYPVDLLLQWYQKRWQAELNFRYVKTQLALAELTCKSPEMARKEFYAAMLAYNFIRASMYQASAANPSTLSFSKVRSTLLLEIAKIAQGTVKLDLSSRPWFIDLLQELARCRLPKRKKTRPSEPRAVRRRPQVFPALKGDREKTRSQLQLIVKS